MPRTESLESELKKSELIKERDLTGKYREIVKKLNDVLPDLIGLETNLRKAVCIRVLSGLADLRLRDIPALEKQLRAMRDEVTETNKLRKINRSEAQTKQIYANFEKNIKNKKP